MIFRRRSLTLRLTLLFGLTSTVVLVLIGYTFYMSLGAHFLHEDAIELQGKVELVRNLVGRLQQHDDLDSLSGRLQDALVGHHNLHLDLRSPDGKIILSIPATQSPLDDPARRELSSHDVEGLPITSVDVSNREYRVTGFDVPTHWSDLPTLHATIAMNVDHHQAFMVRVLGTILVSVLLGALAAGLLGWGVARVGIAPVRAFSALTSRITVDRLNDRISVDNLPPELADLGRSFNAMLARLEDSFRRLKEFSSDLAHELRTPISALLTQAQVALSRSRSADEYREVIYSAMEEYNRLARMTTDMLFLAKADSGLIVPAGETFEVRPEILALFDFYDALAESRQLKLEMTGSGTLRGDRIMFRRAVSNLLSNAIRHSAPGGTVSIQIATGPTGTTLAVVNQGQPIPSEHLPRLFDRFYMADPARQRISEGSGLGLAITKSIIDAHGGTISVTSNAEKTRFEMRLPATG